MRESCVNIILRLGTSVVSAIFVAVGVLLLVVGLLSSAPLSGARTALSIVAALGAAYVFIQVGRVIWRDLRGSGTAEQEGEHIQHDSKSEE
ncbi:hypothetical protein BH23ACT11_BH23ACT11_06660 [soil metagenome]